MSNVPITIAAPIPPKRPKSSQGSLARDNCNIVSSTSTSCSIPAAN